jgi:uncharacterized protein (TIGR03435 family)
MFQLPVLSQARPSFDVASIKRNITNERPYYGFHVGDDRILIRNMSVKWWIQTAYGVTDLEMSGGPGWISAENFDLEAKAERPVRSTNEMFQLLQALMEDRFGLKVHREVKEISVFALVAAKDGVRMKASSDQTGWVGDFPNGAPDGRVLTAGGPRELGPGRIAGDALPMTMIANLLTAPLGRKVVNKTGLTGRYDVDLRYTPGSGQAPAAADEPPSHSDAPAESLFTAVQRQLGLKLELTRAPIEMLVIDHVERPSAN